MFNSEFELNYRTEEATWPFRCHSTKACVSRNGQVATQHGLMNVYLAMLNAEFELNYRTGSGSDLAVSVPLN